MGERMEAEKSIKSCFQSDLVRISKLATCIRFVFCGRFSLSKSHCVKYVHVYFMIVIRHYVDRFISLSLCLASHMSIEPRPGTHFATCVYRSIYLFFHTIYAITSSPARVCIAMHALANSLSGSY